MAHAAVGTAPQDSPSGGGLQDLCVHLKLTKDLGSISDVLIAELIPEIFTEHEGNHTSKSCTEALMLSVHLHNAFSRCTDPQECRFNIAGEGMNIPQSPVSIPHFHSQYCREVIPPFTERVRGAHQRLAPAKHR